MPLNSTMQHVKEVVNGVAFPSNVTYDGTQTIPALQAHITIPVGAVLTDGPHAFVWGGTLHEGRQTMGGPRTQQVGTPGSAFRETNHRIDILLRWALPLALTKIDSVFPTVIDTVMEVLRGTAMPAQIVDEVTGRPSTIHIIGEEFDVDYGQVYAYTDQRYALWGAKIVMPVKEVFQQ